MLPKLSDREIVLLYREWSESHYAAGFYMLPSGGGIHASFIAWLADNSDRPYESYEQDLIERWRAMESLHEPNPPTSST